MKNRVVKIAILILSLLMIAVGMLKYIHPAVNFPLVIVGALGLVLLVISMNANRSETGVTIGPLLAELAILVALIVPYIGGIYLTRWAFDERMGIPMSGIALLLMLICVVSFAVVRWKKGYESPGWLGIAEGVLMAILGCGYLFVLILGDATILIS
ncbi:MAG: hypothetical protein IJY24_00750 [Clostridia bacterium]|nr:hypothetical protein [Clostridia bacterium]